MVEMVVVVIIISALVVLAVPSITSQMRDRRTQRLSENVSIIYRNARMRAMGRGSAVLVRYDRSNSPEGTLEVREGVEGLTAATARGCRRQLRPPTHIGMQNQ